MCATKASLGREGMAWGCGARYIGSARVVLGSSGDEALLRGQVGVRVGRRVPLPVAGRLSHAAGGALDEGAVDLIELSCAVYGIGCAGLVPDTGDPA